MENENFLEDALSSMEEFKKKKTKKFKLPENIDKLPKDERDEIYRQKHEAEVAWVDDWIAFELNKLELKMQNEKNTHINKEETHGDKIEKLTLLYQLKTKTNTNPTQISDIYKCFLNKRSFIIQGDNEDNHLQMMKIFNKEIKQFYKMDFISLQELKYLFLFDGYNGINEYIFNKQTNKNNNGAILPKNVCFYAFNPDDNNKLEYMKQKYDFVNQLISDRIIAEERYLVRTYYLTKNFLKNENLTNIITEETIELLNKKFNKQKGNIILW